MALGEARKGGVDLRDARARDRFGGFLVGAEPQVFLHGQLGEHLAAFGNAGDAGRDDPMGRKPRDVGAVERDAAGARRRQPEDRADQRGLA